MQQRYGQELFQPGKNQKKYFYIYLCISVLWLFSGLLAHPGHAARSPLAGEK